MLQSTALSRTGSTLKCRIPGLSIMPFHGTLLYAFHIPTFTLVHSLPIDRRSNLQTPYFGTTQHNTIRYYASQPNAQTPDQNLSIAAEDNNEKQREAHAVRCTKNPRLIGIRIHFTDRPRSRPRMTDRAKERRFALPKPNSDWNPYLPCTK